MKNKTLALILILGMIALTAYTFNAIKGIDQDPFSIELEDE